MLEYEIRKNIINRWKNHTRITRIESRETQSGIPDLHIRSKTADWWVELKQVKVAYLGDMIVPWRRGQVTWIHNHTRYNGNAAVIINIDPLYYIVQASNFVDAYNDILDYYSCIDDLKQRASYHGLLQSMPDDVWEIK